MAALGDRPSSSRWMTPDQVLDYECWWKAVTDPDPGEVVGALMRILAADGR